MAKCHVPMVKPSLLPVMEEGEQELEDLMSWCSFGKGGMFMSGWKGPYTKPG